MINMKDKTRSQPNGKRWTVSGESGQQATSRSHISEDPQTGAELNRLVATDVAQIIVPDSKVRVTSRTRRRRRGAREEGQMVGLDDQAEAIGSWRADPERKQILVNNGNKHSEHLKKSRPRNQAAYCDHQCNHRATPGKESYRRPEDIDSPTRTTQTDGPAVGGRLEPTEEDGSNRYEPREKYSNCKQQQASRLCLIGLAPTIIYILMFTSSFTLASSSSSGWRNAVASLTSARSSSGQRQQATMVEDELIGDQPHLSNNDNNNNKQSQNGNQNSRRLMIGQHYNNFSSIVPYSIVQDSDYGQLQEDQTVDESGQEQGYPIQQQQQAHPMQQAQLITGAGERPGERERTRKEPISSRALLPLDSNNRLRLPQMQQIKSRFNQGCVGGTKCQFFAFCWMSGGSLGASCGLLMTCCVTPSRQEIQPGFYGPVVNDPYCGRSTSKINRIVGGTDASFGQFPWQAFVQVGGSRCGGALISSRHVVTAGHCVARSQHSPSSIKVTLGDYILNSDIESIPHEVFSVVEVLLHPNFRFTPQADRYDVAVLELDRTAAYKDNIKPICLPQKDAAFVGRVAYVAGWGALQAGSKLRPKVLQHVAVPVIENQVCESWHRRKGIDIRIYDEMMCAGYELGQRDACQGDSGGPLMLNQFGVWYLVGIVSAGYSCAKQYQPGIYHRVSSSSDWISSNIYREGASK